MISLFVTMHYQTVVTSLIVIIIIEFVCAFHKFDINHLLLKLDRNQLDLSYVQEKWIDQPLDHFNTKETRTLRMRYFENLGQWRPNGSIFIFINGETAYPDWIATSGSTLLGQLAQETNAAMFAPEHRYYGKTLPHITKHTIIEYYKYLSSRQALADFAYLIMKMKSKSEYKWSKVVVVGGSHGGNLAAWLRELYPELVDAAIASSAPVLAKKDFHEFFDFIRYTLHTYGTEDCLKNIENRYKRYERLLTSRRGMDILKRELNICPSTYLTLLENKQYLFYKLNLKLTSAIMKSHTPGDVKITCGKFQNTSEVHDVDCEHINFPEIKFKYPWVNQMCREFGYFASTSSEKEPFVSWNPLNFFLKFCKYLINGDIEKTVDEGIARTNKMYGGRTPKVSKVVFTHGDMDPWRALGVLQDLGPDAPVTIVNGTGHCTILAVHPGESKDLTTNREYIKRLIKQWIAVS